MATGSSRCLHTALEQKTEVNRTAGEVSVCSPGKPWSGRSEPGSGRSLLVFRRSRVLEENVGSVTQEFCRPDSLPVTQLAVSKR